jgi:hypothetical protein
LHYVRQLEIIQQQCTGNNNNISITDPNIVQLINGTWYLQYTSPSTIEKQDEETEEEPILPSMSNDDIWEASNAQQENISDISTFRAKGTVSAGGIVIDTSNKLVQQIFDIQQQSVMNEIQLYTNSNNNITIVARAGGTYQPSSIQSNRAIIAFNIAQIRIQFNERIMICLNFGWIFTIISILFQKGNRNNGWLETTYIDTTLRIGRGNKGTMFILTR